MAYFGKFEQIQYAGKTVTNITNSILLKYRPAYNTTLYTYHTVSDGETAETLAHKYYGTAQDHWIILLLNDIVDPFFGWSLTSPELIAMVKSKYGDDYLNRVHHLFDTGTQKIVDQLQTSKYVTNEGEIYNEPLPINYQIITNHDYEISKNDKKRDIKILATQYVQDFKNQFEDLLNGEGIV